MNHEFQAEAKPAIRWLRKLTELSHGAVISYATIILAQLLVLAYKWDSRDLTTGDTSSYFSTAREWHETGAFNILWSPLYTSFYGSVLNLSSDAYIVTILHRIIIVVAVTALVLTLFRKLLPAGLAWICALWWAINPINYDTLYEVHLFAVIPLVLTCLVCAGAGSPWKRGIALACFVLTTVFMRNELVLPTMGFALSCLAYEASMWIARRKNLPKPSLWRLVILPYGLPILLAGGICTGAYEYSIRTKFGSSETLRASLELKHTLNMAQVYAFSYQQRHPEWTGSPWVDYAPLVKSIFGNELPSMTEMIKSNPRAYFGHVWWNLKLLPSGLEVLLFDATSGDMNPDYASVALGKWYPRPLLIGVSLTICIGAWLMFRERTYWLERWLKPNAWLLVAMTCAMLAAILIIPTQRPRPSYLFFISICLMAGFAISLAAIFRRFVLRSRAAAAASGGSPFLDLETMGRYALPAAIVATFITFAMLPWGRQPTATPFADKYHRVLPYATIVGSPGGDFLAGSYAGELWGYLGKQQGRKFSDYGVLQQWDRKESLADFLAKKNVKLLYLDEDQLSKLEKERPELTGNLLEGRVDSSWRDLALGGLPGDRWRLLEATH